MKKLFEDMIKTINQLFSGNVCIIYDSSENREIVNVRLSDTTPEKVLEIRNGIQKSYAGINCFTGGDIRLENDFEWKGNDKTYPLVHIDFYLCEEMLDYYEGKISYFNGKYREE